MTQPRITVQLPTHPDYQTSLAVLVGRACMLTSRVWSPVSIIPVIANTVCLQSKVETYHEILGYVGRFGVDPPNYTPPIAPHTRYLSLPVATCDILDRVVERLRHTSGTTIGIHRKTVVIAMTEWASHLPSDQLLEHCTSPTLTIVPA